MKNNKRNGVVVYVTNMFQPERHRRVMETSAPITVNNWLESQGALEFSQPVLCIFNGGALMRKWWASRFISSGDVCIFLTLPAGGGGSGGGKNPLKTVLSVALMVAAPHIGAGLSSVLGITGALGKSIIDAGVLLGGSVLVSALVPPPKAASAAFSGGSLGVAPVSVSPTYNLQGQGNIARLGQSIAVQYGRHKVFPDLVATPWSNYNNNQQYIYQAHCLGYGVFDMERINVADTEINKFSEITYEVVPPGRALNLFDINVITRAEVSGQELKTGEYVGPFILNPVDSIARKVGIDVILPRGLYYANSRGNFYNKTISWRVEGCRLNDNDVPISDWYSIAEESYQEDSPKVIRLSFTYTLPSAGRYQIRLKRTDSKDSSSRAGHEIRWAGLRAYVDGPQRFDDVSLLLVKMKATDNLSQRTARSINVIQTRKLPIWDHDNNRWTDPVVTRNPIWAIVDVLKSKVGAELPDIRIDLQGFVGLADLLNSRGDYFDGVFDTKTTVWDALIKIARCGRSVPILQGGIVRVIRDSLQSLPVSMFCSRNIVRGSFNISYIMPSDDTADAVIVEYFNHRTWRPDQVTCKLESSQEEKPAIVSLFGCTSASHAQREGNYIVADNCYRRKIVTFRTELDGMIPTYGDLITVTHDMPFWGGVGGEVVEWDPIGQILTLSEPVEWIQNADHVIALRANNGSLHGPFACEQQSIETQVKVIDSLSFTPYTGNERERTYFTFGTRDNWTKMCRVISVRPKSGGTQVEISAVVEDNRVHTN